MFDTNSLKKDNRFHPILPEIRDIPPGRDVSAERLYAPGVNFLKKSFAQF
jgi:hypothetical protein